MFCTLNKEGSLGYKLMYYDSGNTLYTVLIFHDEVFPTYPENHNTKIWAFFINQETKAKLFLAVIKDNTNIFASFFMKTGIILLHVHVNCLDTRFFFSNINWSPFFFSFSLTLSLFGPEMHSCIQRQILLGLLLLIICIFSAFLFRKWAAHSKNFFKKLKKKQKKIKDLRNYILQ